MAQGLIRRLRESAEVKRTAARIRRLPDEDLRRWVDGCLYAIGRAVSEGSKKHEPEVLDAYHDTAVGETMVLFALVDELRARRQI